MATVQYNPDELDRGAQSLDRSHSALVAEAKRLRSAVDQMPGFRGREADKFRADLQALSRSLQKQADEVGKRAAALRTFAKAVRSMRLR